MAQQTFRKPTAEDFEFPVDATPQEIDSFVKKQAPIKVDAPPRMTNDELASAINGRPIRMGLRPEAFPAAGAVLGSIAGPPGAAIGGALGSLAKQVVNPTHTSGMDAAMEVGQDAVFQGALQKGGELVGQGMKAAAPWLMQKVLKPAKSLIDEYRTTGPKIVRTLLDEGVNVTQDGLEKLQSILSATNAEIKSLVDNAPGVITKQNVAARVLPVAARVGNQTNPQEGLKQIAETVDGFMKHPIHKGNLTPRDAHAMKKATYEKIGKSYGEMSTAQKETEKALARGLKEEVAEAVPGVAALNQRDAELMAAGESVAKRIAADANADPLGLLYAATNPQLFIAGLIQRQPVIRSMIANGMWANAAKVAKVSPDVIRGAVLALTSGAPAPAPDQE